MKRTISIGIDINVETEDPDALVNEIKANVEEFFEPEYEMVSLEHGTVLSVDEAFVFEEETDPEPKTWFYDLDSDPRRAGVDFKQG